jgi:hypothetical protein
MRVVAACGGGVQRRRSAGGSSPSHSSTPAPATVLPASLGEPRQSMSRSCGRWRTATCWATSGVPMTSSECHMLPRSESGSSRYRHHLEHLGESETSLMVSSLIH